MSAVYAARAAAAAINGRHRRRDRWGHGSPDVGHYFFPFAEVEVLADADPLGMGAGLGPAEFASD